MRMRTIRIMSIFNLKMLGECATMRVPMTVLH